MMQGMLVSTLTTSGNSGVYGSTPLWRSHFKLQKSTLLPASRIGKQCLMHLCVQCLFYKVHPDIPRKRNFRVEAGWPFKGGDQGLDQSSERSESANEDILIFFFQLDLATRVQCALNLEQYEIAQQLRNKLTEVEEEVIRQREAKRGSSAKSEAQDKAISIIRLRADLQNAIESENYASAAELRDEISKLEAESLAVSAKALAFENAQYAFRLGQKVRHKMFGYRAVVCGMDPVCCESSSWMEIANVEKLPRGSNQPFYQVAIPLPVQNATIAWRSMMQLPAFPSCLQHVDQVNFPLQLYSKEVLVDVHVDPNLLVAYVPEDNLLAPDQPDMGRFDHPYISFLFYGMDTAGDFIPIKELREKYNRPRHEVPSDPQDEQSGEDA